ncbi:MAG TPA: ribonuclease HII [Candidatus Dormibacteraeota bacterium]|nr:ribonuclease HII [Candidatus Dormibacteraeota bacterium]
MTSVGIDEVGRGCWAGPLVAGAVILNQPIDGLKDSKKLSANQRQQLAKTIHSEAGIAALGWVTAKEIDSLGLTKAVSLAMQRAIDQIQMDYQEIIIDGNYNFLFPNPKSRTIIKADCLVAEVSAASIIAKVARDQYMSQVAKKYPNYGFEKHVGYGTDLHRERLQKYGPCDQHRRSFKPIQLMLDTRVAEEQGMIISLNDFPTIV